MPISPAIMSANEIRDQFLDLFISQMRNQNPLEPLDNHQMTTQLAQFSQIEQLQRLNASFSQILRTQQLADASALIGRRVGFYDESLGQLISGIAERAVVVDDAVSLIVEGLVVPLSDVISVEPAEDQAATAAT